MNESATSGTLTLQQIGEVEKWARDVIAAAALCQAPGLTTGTVNFAKMVLAAAWNALQTNQHSQLTRLVDARLHIIELRDQLFRSHRFQTPLSETDRIVDKILDDSDRWLDGTCSDGNPHRSVMTDGGPAPCKCSLCKRLLP